LQVPQFWQRAERKKDSSKVSGRAAVKVWLGTFEVGSAPIHELASWGSTMQVKGCSAIPCRGASEFQHAQQRLIRKPDAFGFYRGSSASATSVCAPLRCLARCFANPFANSAWKLRGLIPLTPLAQMDRYTCALRLNLRSSATSTSSGWNSVRGPTFMTGISP
jgi:hypothetical protein